jgi:hypothetical protein
MVRKASPCHRRALRTVPADGIFVEKELERAQEAQQLAPNIGSSMEAV